MNRSKIASGFVAFALLMVVNVPSPQTQKPASAQKSVDRPSTSALCIPAQPLSCRPTTVGNLTETSR